MVGVPNDRCPVFYVDNGELVGIGVDLMRDAAKEAGYVPAYDFYRQSGIRQDYSSKENC